MWVSLGTHRGITPTHGFVPVLSLNFTDWDLEFEGFGAMALACALHLPTNSCPIHPVILI